jgi:hypothetical protein
MAQAAPFLRGMGAWGPAHVISKKTLPPNPVSGLPIASLADARLSDAKIVPGASLGPRIIAKAAAAARWGDAAVSTEGQLMAIPPSGTAAQRAVQSPRRLLLVNGPISTAAATRAASAAAGQAKPSSAPTGPVPPDPQGACHVGMSEGEGVVVTASAHDKACAGAGQVVHELHAQAGEQSHATAQLKH